MVLLVKLKPHWVLNFCQFEKACCEESDEYVKLLKGFGFGDYDETQMLLIKIEVESLVQGYWGVVCRVFSVSFFQRCALFLFLVLDSIGYD